MKKISSKVHGVLDYLGGIALIAAPMLFGFEDLGGAAVWIPRVLGVAFLLQALMTDYELGVVKVLPFSMHLMVDYLAAAFLAISPFLFNFADEDANVWMPHLVVGITYFVITMMTKSKVESHSVGRPSLA